MVYWLLNDVETVSGFLLPRFGCSVVQFRSGGCCSLIISGRVARLARQVSDAALLLTAFVGVGVAILLGATCFDT